MGKPLSHILFGRMQFWFQIIFVTFLLVLLLSIRIGLEHYCNVSGVDYSRFAPLMTALFIMFAVLGIAVMWLTMHTQHVSLSKELSPLSRLANEINGIVSGLKVSENCISDLTKTLKLKEGQNEETKSLILAFENLGNMLARYWQISTKNEVMAAIGQMAAHVVHDMKNPLSTIKDYLSHEECVPPDPDLATLYQAAIRSGNKLHYMMDDMLDYSKAMNLERSIVGFGSLVKSVFSEMKGEADRRNINLTYDGPPQLMINVDAKKMDRVLSNMVANSIQAIKNGSGEIKITAIRDGGNNLVAVIRDNGSGILPEHMPRIFDNTFTFGKPNGTGLGLSYCKNVIEAHGGTVAAESTAGKGATFEITLPNVAIDLSSDNLRKVVFNQ